MTDEISNSCVVVIFIDGLGIGRRTELNPLNTRGMLSPLAFFGDDAAPGEIFSDGLMIPTDPRLGVEGRPQSASGQTTILTGINAPRLLGYHKQGFPNEALRGLLRESSVFRQLITHGVNDVCFANAYSPAFFESEPRWKSATTVAVESAGLKFRNFEDLRDGHAVFHDFTNRLIADLTLRIPVLTPGAAAANLCRLARQNRFVLYEHFITDKLGHAQDFRGAVSHLGLLAEFVREVVLGVDLGRTTVILTSDHGNIEDLSVRNHTLNDVPTVIWGRRRDDIVPRIRDLADLTPTIVHLLTT